MRGGEPAGHAALASGGTAEAEGEPLPSLILAQQGLLWGVALWALQ